ncbi:hypothetical protein SAMN05660443_0664 [Marinospirillum celere]|uniref:Uncharacterized protein n=1 Tax=Marinospirillum celere TaxID=1122252 RepID=A0A1I1ERJ4_9GAMM|nr:hypothetical protein [Marinospirillum celere]SFB87540.1 hypothetical protein SAMN05660443_0664 [Marinospirillum celere]
MRFSLFGVAVLALFLSACKSDPNRVHHVEDEVRETIKAQISQQYREPEATRFRVQEIASYDPNASEFVKEFISNATSYMLCGEVNGKNRFGSYGGYKHFAALYLSALDEGGDPEVDVMYQGNPGFDSFASDCP